MGEAVDGELDAALPQQDWPHLDVLQIGHLWKMNSVKFDFNPLTLGNVTLPK